MKLFNFNTDKAWDYENGFYLTSPLSRLAKAIAQYELYKMIVGIPGDIMECGVYKGASLIRWFTFRDMLENPYSREIIGIDTFSKFPEPTCEDDKIFVKEFISLNGEGISVDELTKVLQRKGFVNFNLCRADIRHDLISTYDKLALLHVDLDCYDATKSCLEIFYDHIVPGGLCVLDDYGDVSGATRAIDEFFKDKDIKFEKLSIAHKPTFVRVK